MHTEQTRLQELNSLSMEFGFTDEEFRNIANRITSVTADYMTDSLQVSVWMFTDKADEMECLALYRNNVGFIPDVENLNMALYPKYFSTLQTSDLIDASNARTDLRTRELNDSYLIPNNIHALLDCPIHYNGETLGIICCEYQKITHWSDTDINFIRLAAEQLSIACKQKAHTELHKKKIAISNIQKQFYDHSPDACWLLDFKTAKIIYCNDRSLELFEADDSHQIIGKTPLDLSPEYQSGKKTSLDLLLEQSKSFEPGCSHSRFHWIHTTLKGKTFDAEVTISTPPLSGEGVLLAEIRDITELKNSRERLYKQAYFCSLTGLPNRRNFIEMLELRSAEKDQTFHLLLLDIKGFQRINQSLGQKLADQLLVQLSQRLQDIMQEYPESSIARVGGNEFAIYLPELKKTSIEAFSHALHSRLTQNYTIENIELMIELTIVACHFPDDANSADSLLRILGLTLEHARNKLKNILTYNNDIKDITEIRRILLTQLKTAIEENQFYLLYQPKVKLADSSCYSFEALIRWQHPKWGFLSPADFIPTAEATELITPITHWVIDSVCKQVAQWKQQGVDISIAINLATRNLLDSRLPAFVAEKLEAYDIAAHNIEFEITESSLMQDPEKAMRTLEQLNQLGTRLAIDDFGTGYSSMAYVKKLPVSALKIDREFIKELPQNENDQVIVRSTIQMAHNLGLKVIAEGIEDKSSMDMLFEMQCDFIQGFYISKPVHSEEAFAFISKADNKANLNWSI